MIEQTATVRFKSECGKSAIFVDSDMPVGLFHDFLLKVKGQMVDVMVNAQKEEEKMAESQSQTCCSE